MAANSRLVLLRLTRAALLASGARVIEARFPAWILPCTSFISASYWAAPSNACSLAAPPPFSCRMNSTAPLRARSAPVVLPGVSRTRLETSVRISRGIKFSEMSPPRAASSPARTLASTLVRASWDHTRAWSAKKSTKVLTRVLSRRNAGERGTGAEPPTPLTATPRITPSSSTRISKARARFSLSRKASKFPVRYASRASMMVASTFSGGTKWLIPLSILDVSWSTTIFSRRNPRIDSRATSLMSIGNIWG